MVTENDISVALHELYKRVGTQSALAELAGITQSTINAYLNGKAKIENMPVGVFLKLFRNMQIDFFGGRSENSLSDELRAQLLELFDTLDDNGKVRLVTMAAANFGEQIRKETRV